MFTKTVYKYISISTYRIKIKLYRNVSMCLKSQEIIICQTTKVLELLTVKGHRIDGNKKLSLLSMTMFTS